MKGEMFISNMTDTDIIPYSNTIYMLTYILVVNFNGTYSIS